MLPIVGPFATAHDAAKQASELNASTGLSKRPTTLPNDPGAIPGTGSAQKPDPGEFRKLTGHDPSNEQDWRTAAALDPKFGENGVPAIIGSARIRPVKGAGQVYGDAFIRDKEVLGVPPHLMHKGDDRGADPATGPDKSRASMLVDFENGLAIVRQNPSHSTDGASGAHPAEVGAEQDADGRVRLRTQATNGLIPQWVGDVGESVRGDFIIDPHGGSNGTPSANGLVTQYPSWVMYSSKPGQPASPLLQREQNGGGLLGPAFNLPRPSVPVGQHPEKMDEWRQKYHADQVRADQAQGLSPYYYLHDPKFYNYPLPNLGTGVPDGHGGTTIPQAGQVR
jgi:hypothetical protein